MTVKQLKRLISKEKCAVKDINVDDLTVVVYDETDREHIRFLEIEEVELDLIFKEGADQAKPENSCEVLALSVSGREFRIPRK